MAFSCNNVINAGIFDVLAYTDKEAEVPITWIESDAKLIENPQMVKLHSFDTKVVIILILLVVQPFGISFSSSRLNAQDEEGVTNLNINLNSRLSVIFLIYVPLIHKN